MPVSATIAQLAAIALGLLLVAAAIEDVRRLVIPNRLVMAVVALYPAHALATPVAVDWIGALLVAGAALAAGYLLFLFRLFGGGDAKLFAATALWAGPSQFTNFLFVMALAGAAVAIGMIVHRWARPAHRGPQRSMLPARLAAHAQALGHSLMLMPYRRALRAGAPEAGARQAAGRNDLDAVAPAAPGKVAAFELPYGVAIAAGGLQIVATMLIGG